MTTRSVEAPRITIGNHTYISLYIGGIPHKKVSDILIALQEFEQAHPELEVTSWNIEKHIQNICTSPPSIYTQGQSELNYYIDGLWINHRPREKKGE